MEQVYLIFVILVSLMTGSANRRSPRDCRYEFQVWQPNQDQQRHLENLELQFANLSNYVGGELARHQIQQMHDITDVRNWSVTFERSLTDLKNDQLQKYTEFQELKQKINLFEFTLDAVNGKVENSVYYSNAGKKTSRKDRTVGLHESQADTPRHHMVENLKLMVYDLKSEWILLKRDFIKMKNDNADIKKEQLVIQKCTKDMENNQIGVKKQFAELEDTTKEMTDEITDLTSDIDDINKVISDLKTDHRKMLADVKNRESALASLQASSVDMRHGIMDLQTSYERIVKVRNMNEISLPKSDGGVTLQASQDGETSPPKDCQDIFEIGYMSPGVFKVKPGPNFPKDTVYCDLDTSSAYTVIQRRVDGLQDFNRGWLEYKYGFGNVYGEFWIGNELLHQLTTANRYSLRVEMLDWEGNLTFAEYDQFRIGDESSRYDLHVSGYHGNAGDSLSYHGGMKFSTKDLDNDIHNRNCAAENKGGWWFNGCYFSNLNGVYHVGWYASAKYTFADGIVWYTLKDSDRYSLRKVEMKIKRLK